MKKTNPNDPANPVSGIEYDAPKDSISFDASHYDLKVNYSGMTKREEFAKAAMIAYAGGEYIGQSGKPYEQIAEWCVCMADALIDELNKPLTPSHQ
jgi:hypothetical protein